MTTDILTPTQENHNTVTKSGYQWLVWWFGKSAGFTTPRRAQEELARLQRYEAPQKQALSLLETLYTQYDSMAEQYEAMTQYIKTTFSLEKLNKVIDQLTADLMAVTECHPQMVQQAQAQALGATAPDSVTLNEVTTSPLNPILAAEYHKQGKMSLYELGLVCPDAIKVLDGESVTLSEVTTEDEWPTVSISLDDEDFCHPDSLGDLWHAQQVQLAQAQHRTCPPIPNPNDLAYIVTSVEANIFTLQAPADSHIAKLLQAWLIVHEAIEYLEPCGYSLVARLKADFGFFVTPKTLSKKITQTLTSLKEAKSSGLSVADFDEVPFTAQQEAMDNVGFIWSVIKKLEALA